MADMDDFERLPAPKKCSKKTLNIGSKNEEGRETEKENVTEKERIWWDTRDQLVDELDTKACLTVSKNYFKTIYDHFIKLHFHSIHKYDVVDSAL